MKRSTKTILIGSAIAVVGVVVFFCAHAIVTPGSYTVSDIELVMRSDAETRWATFGTGLVVSGALIVSVGMAEWCRRTD